MSEVILGTRLVSLCLPPEDKSDVALACLLNVRLNHIIERGGNLRAYAILSDQTNQAGARFVKVLATFSGLNKNWRGGR